MALKWRLLLLFFCCTLLSLNPAECQKNLWIQFCKQVSQPFGPNLVYKTPSLGETGFSWNNSKLLLLCTKGVPSFCKISVNMRFRIFFKIFMVVIFVHLWCPVTMQNFRKKIWSGFRSPGGANRSLFKVFAIVTFIYLQSPITIQNFRKILTEDFENNAYNVLGQIWGIFFHIAINKGVRYVIKFFGSFVNLKYIIIQKF